MKGPLPIAPPPLMRTPRASKAAAVVARDPQRSARHGTLLRVSLARISTSAGHARAASGAADKGVSAKLPGGIRYDVRKLRVDAWKARGENYLRGGKCHHLVGRWSDTSRYRKRHYSEHDTSLCWQGRTRCESSKPRGLGRSHLFDPQAALQNTQSLASGPKMITGAPFPHSYRCHRAVFGLARFESCRAQVSLPAARTVPGDKNVSRQVPPGPNFPADSAAITKPSVAALQVRGLGAPRCPPTGHVYVPSLASSEALSQVVVSAMPSVAPSHINDMPVGTTGGVRSRVEMGPGWGILLQIPIEDRWSAPYNNELPSPHPSLLLRPWPLLDFSL